MPHIRDRFTLPPVGTIYWSPVAERAWKVVKRTEKTLWLPGLEWTDQSFGVYDRSGGDPLGSFRFLGYGPA